MGGRPLGDKIGRSFRLTSSCFFSLRKLLLSWFKIERQGRKTAKTVLTRYVWYCGFYLPKVFLHAESWSPVAVIPFRNGTIFHFYLLLTLRAGCISEWETSDEVLSDFH